MKKCKALLITTTVLALLVALLGAYLIYDRFIKPDDAIQPEAKVYTYDDLEGLYTHISDSVTNEFGNEIFSYHYLYLYANGTFNYRMGTGAPFGRMGNYIIKDNTIILNYLFSTNSGAGINVTTGSKTINITDIDTLVDNTPSVVVGDATSVTLKRASAEKEREFLDGGDFSTLLDNSIIDNKASDNPQ